MNSSEQDIERVYMSESNGAQRQNDIPYKNAQHLICVRKQTNYEKNASLWLAEVSNFQTNHRLALNYVDFSN